MKGPRVITGMVKTNVHDHYLFKIQMGELESLLRALGYRIMERIIQVRPKPTVDYIFGKGKVEEIRARVRALEPDAFVIYNTMTSKQKWNLERVLGVEVIDRYDVTLMIFREAARDILSKLQIELAALEKSFPYIKLSASMKYKKMRAGFRGGGEYAYHKQVRAVQKRMKILRRKIDKLSAHKEMEILRRLKDGSKISVLTGYYNAGKTSLFNALTGFDKPTSDMPFTTLSSKYGVVGDSIYVVDTIGFVLDLDPRLIASFKINLLDIEYSQRPILVVDISDKDLLMRIKLRESVKILESIGKDLSNMVIAANKVDKVEQGEVDQKLKIIKEVIGSSIPIIPVSAKEGIGLDELVEEISGKRSEVLAGGVG